MHRTRTYLGSLAIPVAFALLAPAPAAGQDMPRDGFRLGLGLDLNAVAFGGAAETILGDPEAGPGLGYWASLGYGYGAIAVSVGLEATAVATGDREAMGSLAMPFELQFRPPVRLLGVAPSVVIGYVRYGMGHREVPASRLPEIIAGRDHEVGFLGNALRVGAGFHLPVGDALLLKAKPVIDLIRFSQISFEEGAVRLEEPGSTTRFGFSVGIVYDM